MKKSPGVYYYINPAEELMIYKLDYDGTWYVLDALNGNWNIMRGTGPYCGLDNLKPY